MATSIYQPSPAQGTCLYQGEILSDLIRVRLDLKTIQEDQPGVLNIVYPYAVVLTQACDLTQDFRERGNNQSQLPNMLFCHLPTAEELRRNTSGMNSTIWDRVKKNKDERYHFLERIPEECDACGEGLPELGADFKQYFTIPAEEVYRRIEIGQSRRRCILCTPYVEHLSGRFAYFIGRVALPRDHTSE